MDMLEKGSVVISLAGRDSGMLFIVIGNDEEYAYLADGKLRSIEKPKKKKLKHLKVVRNEVSDKLTEKLQTGKKIENAEIRKVLNQFSTQEVL